MSVLEKCCGIRSKRDEASSRGMPSRWLFSLFRLETLRISDFEIMATIEIPGEGSGCGAKKQTCLEKGNVVSTASFLASFRTQDFRSKLSDQALSPELFLALSFFFINIAMAWPVLQGGYGWGRGQESLFPAGLDSKAHRLSPAIPVSCFEELTMGQIIFNKHR